VEVGARRLVVVLPAAGDVVAAAAGLASTALLPRIGAITIVVASRIRSVTPATAASATSGS
jgi:hypothetical protein